MTKMNEQNWAIETCGWAGNICNEVHPLWYKCQISPAQLLSTFIPFDQTFFFQKMDLGSSVSHFPGLICYQRVGVRTSSRRVNGQSDVGCQDGVVVEVSSQRKLFKNWSILVNLVSSRFLKKMSGSLVLQDCELDIPMKRWWENLASGWHSYRIAICSTSNYALSKSFRIYMSLNSL